jgi:hypothetical protein
MMMIFLSAATAAADETKEQEEKSVYTEFFISIWISRSLSFLYP